MACLWPACPVFCYGRAMRQASFRPDSATYEPEPASDKPFRAMTSHELRGLGCICPRKGTGMDNQAMRGSRKGLGKDE